MLRRKRKGQSTAEYAIVIGLVIAAAVAMQVYVKRSIQGKMKDAVDTNADNATFLVTQQYEPEYQTNDGLRTTRASKESENTSEGGGVTRTIVGKDVSTRTGTTHILAP